MNTIKSAEEILSEYETYVRYSDVPIFLKENVLKAMEAFHSQFSNVWVKASERLPLDGKEHFCKDEKNCKVISFYCKEEDKTICEYDDYDDGDVPDFLIVDKEKELFYYKTGWYSVVENVGTYDYIIYERKVVEWLDEQPVSKKSNAVGNEEINKMAADFCNKNIYDSSKFMSDETQEEWNNVYKGFIAGWQAKQQSINKVNDIEETAIDFAKWIHTNYAPTHSMKWIKRNVGGDEFSTRELYEQYLKNSSQ